MISIAARLVPPLRGRRGRHRQRFGDVVRRVDCGLSRRRDGTVGRGAAARDCFVASRGFCACDGAVFAGVVDDAGDDQAGQCGVLGKRVLAARRGESRAGECGGPVLGQCCTISWSCVQDCRSGYRACDDGSADDGMIVSWSRVEARESSAWQGLRQCNRRWGFGRSVGSARR